MKIVIAFVLLFVACVTPVFAHEKKDLRDDIFFIASQNELLTARINRDTIRGLAIHIPFYQQLSLIEQGDVDELVRHVISLRLRPVHLYGIPFDKELADRLLSDPMTDDMPRSCSSGYGTLFCGIFSTYHLNTLEAVTIFFSAGGREMTHDDIEMIWGGYRNAVIKNWEIFMTRGTIRNTVETLP